MPWRTEWHDHQGGRIGVEMGVFPQGWEVMCRPTAIVADGRSFPVERFMDWDVFDPFAETVDAFLIRACFSAHKRVEIAQCARLSCAISPA